MERREPDCTALDPLAGCVIVIVAYAAAATITQVLDRIPDEVASHVGAILVSDDSSTDATAELANRWGAGRPEVALTVIRQPRNLGYGGNQRFCYRWAAERGFEHVVMIHGDGQYAPELTLRMLEPLLAGRADAVFGSRMIDRHGARDGGMPLYKRIGNRVLTSVQNHVTGLRLSEWHSGYRAYSLAVLDRIDLGSLSSGFDFDTQIILEMHRLDTTIWEIAIPTFYGTEKCHVNGFRYASQVTREVLRHRRTASKLR